MKHLTKRSRLAGVRRAGAVAGDVAVAIAVAEGLAGVDGKADGLFAGLARGDFVDVAPGAGGVKVFEGKTVGIDVAVAGGAVGVSAVGAQDFLDGPGLADVGFLDLHVGGRRSGMNAEKVFHDVDGAVDGRGGEAVGGGGEEAPMPVDRRGGRR